MSHVHFLGAVSVVVFLLLIGLVLAFPGLQQVALRSPQIAAVVTAVLVNLTNNDRSADGLAPLRVNSQLVAVAQMKANDMAEKGYFAHTSPEGLDPWHWFKEGGYLYRYAGENLAVNFADSEDVVQAWMDSPKHRENILDGRFTEIGIATAQGSYQGRTTTFVVQMFGTPRVAEQASRAAVEESVIPNDPDQIAFASDTSASQEVLSERSEGPGLAQQQPHAVATTEPAVAAALATAAAESGTAPLGYLFGYPKGAMRIAFNILGVLIALALAIETGLEVRKHHRKHALIALLLLGVVVLAFVIADRYLFIAPIISG